MNKGNADDSLHKSEISQAVLKEVSFYFCLIPLCLCKFQAITVMGSLLEDISCACLK